MKSLFGANITYKTHLSEKEVFARLSDFIEPKQIIRSGLFGNKATAPYEGDIGVQTFSIRRIIRYRNSFLPQIEGTVQKDFDGSTLIQIKMRMLPFVIGFSIFWCSIVVFVFLALLIDSITHAKFQPAIFMPLGMFLFFCVLVEFAFGFERDRAKTDLRKLFEAEIVTDIL